MPSSNINQAHQTIINRLQSLRTQWRLLLLSESLLLWLGILSVALTAMLVIDQLLPLHRVLRMGLVVAWLGIGVYTAIRYLIRPVFQKLTSDRVAAYVETSYPGFENRVLSAIQLKPEIENNRFGYALAFIEKLIEQARESIERIELKRVFEREFLKLKKTGGIAVAGIALLIIINLIFPLALKDFAQAFDEIPKTPQEILVVQIDEIQPGNTRIESGKDVTISAKVTGHLGGSVHLYYRFGQAVPAETTPTPSEDNWRSILMTRNDTEIAYSVVFKNVTQSMAYYIRARETDSEHYQITIAREPIVSRFQLKLYYPKYTQLSPQVLEENLGDVTALIGTEVQFEGESNKALASATLAFDDSEATKLRIVSTTEDAGDYQLAGRFIVQRSEKYRIELIDGDGIANSQPIVYTINAIKDAEPEIEIVEPGRDVVIDESMRISLRIDAKDDYGVQNIRLVYRIEGQDEDETAAPLKTWQPPQMAAYIEFPWDLDALGLFPEDVVSYHVEAIDADNS